MRHLSIAFPDARFGLIFHPVSNVFAPDVRPVWHEAFRVLRQYARSKGELLSEVAQRVIQRDLDPADLPLPEGSRNEPR